MSIEIFTEANKAGVSVTGALLLLYANQHPGASLSFIAKAAGVTSSAMTGQVDRLGAMGYLTQKTNPKDRRKHRIELTDKGVILAMRLDPKG